MAEVGDLNMADQWEAAEAAMPEVNGVAATMEATAEPEAGVEAMETPDMVMEATMEAMAGVMAEVIILRKLREVKLVVILAALCEVEEVKVGEQEVAAEGCKGRNLIRGKTIRDQDEHFLCARKNKVSLSQNYH